MNEDDEANLLRRLRSGWLQLVGGDLQLLLRSFIHGNLAERLLVAQLARHVNTDFGLRQRLHHHGIVPFAPVLQLAHGSQVKRARGFCFACFSWRQLVGRTADAAQVEVAGRTAPATDLAFGPRQEGSHGLRACDAILVHFLLLLTHRASKSDDHQIINM